MSVNPIAQDLTGYALRMMPDAAAPSSAKTADVNSSINDQASLQQSVQPSVLPGAIEQLQKKAAVDSSKATSDANPQSQKKPVREMSHVVETYTKQGELQLKFMDSNNNILYQIPSEMEATMKEQMKKPEISSDTTG